MTIRFLIVALIISSIPFCSVFSDDSQKSFGGIGAILNREISGYIRIVDLAPEGPAEQAGIRKNDLLVSVEDTLVSSRLIGEIVAQLRGHLGTPVHVKIIRNAQLMSITIYRGAVTPWIQPECLAGDCRNGYAKINDAYGQIFEGNMIDGKFDGLITIYRLNGEIIKRRFENGQISKEPVTIYYPDNRKYVGTIFEDVPYNSGTMTFEDGTIRKGEWFLGQFIEGCYNGNCQNGQGVYYLPTLSDESSWTVGSIYTCEFANGEPNGYGTVEYPRTKAGVSKFIGNIREFEPQSPGHIYYSNGDYYEGEFASVTYRHGWGKMVYTNGDEYEGDWVENQKDGLGTLMTRDSSFYVGQFSSNKMDGWIVQYVNKQISMHIYKEGRIDPTDQPDADTYMENNRASTGSHFRLQLYTLAREMFDHRCMYGNCENGVGLKSIAFYPAKVYFGEFRNGQPNGKGQLYYEDDKKTYAGDFKDGMRHGMIRVLGDGGGFSFKQVYYKDIAEGFGFKTFAEYEAAVAEKVNVYITEHENDVVGIIPRDDSDNYAGSDNGGSESWRKGKYDVCVSGDCENGHGTIQFGNGDYFQGEMQNGKYNGEGSLKIFDSGYQYYGAFKDNMLHGPGTMYDGYDNKFVGKWEYDKIISGSAYNADGCKVYDGIFRGGYLVGTTYRSSTCDFSSGAKEQVQNYSSSGGSNKSYYTQETIYYNKGTKDQWSITIPVRNRY